MRIAFLCQRSDEEVWTAESVKTGIGGSEEAVIHMAELLGQRGHHVSVHLPDAQGRTFGSVIYDDYNSLRGRVVDVAVMWRYPELAEIQAEFAFRARRSYLWLHDLLPESKVLHYERSYRKVIVLSNYHRERFRRLPNDRILLSANGIDAAHFDGNDGPRDPYLLVYGSDYGRGLAILLACWPWIKEHVPQCQLNVFYRWQGIAARAPDRVKVLHRELDLRQPGISHLGRISHHAVAAQYLRAGIWAYPCWFPETSCISAMKAQAGGAVPVVIPTGALRENVHFGFRTHRGFDEVETTGAPALVSEWLNGLLQLLGSPAEQSRIREAMIPASKARFAWSSVVDQWEREFTNSDDGPALDSNESHQQH